MASTSRSETPISRSAEFSAGAGPHAAATSAELTECPRCGTVRASEPETGGVSAEDLADAARELGEVTHTGSEFLIGEMQRQVGY